MKKIEYPKNFFYDNSMDLLNSLIPDVFSYEYQKLAILIQLVGGRFERNRIRPINCLIIGSPATAKTKISLNLEKLGFNSGLIVGNQFENESLKNILTNNDKIHIFDELDKRFQRKGSVETIKLKNNRNLLLNILRNNEIDKIPIKAPILSIANLGNYNFSQTVFYYEVLQILEKNLSRKVIFSHDIIFYNPDKPNKFTDEKIAEGILNNLSIGIQKPKYNSEEISTYIKYVKENIKPFIPSSISQLIYSKIEELKRQLKQDRKEIFDYIDLFSRQMTSIEHISIALAKLNLREEVNKTDVLNAFEYFKEIIKTFMWETLEKEIKITPKIIEKDLHVLMNIILDLSFEDNIVDFTLDDIKNFREFFKIKSNLKDLIDELLEQKKIIKLSTNKYRRADW